MEEWVARATELYRQGVSVRQISPQVGRSTKTVRLHLRRAGVLPPPSPAPKRGPTLSRGLPKVTSKARPKTPAPGHLLDETFPDPDELPDHTTPYDLVLKILRLHALGRSRAEVAKIAGCSPARVGRVIERELGRFIPPAREAARRASLLRLDAMMDRAAELMLTSTGELALKAIDRMARLEERYAKLLGTDAPTRIEATVREVDQTDLELMQLIDEARALE